MLSGGGFPRQAFQILHFLLGDKNFAKRLFLSQLRQLQLSIVNITCLIDYWNGYTMRVYIMIMEGRGSNLVSLLVEGEVELRAGMSD